MKKELYYLIFTIFFTLCSFSSYSLSPIIDSIHIEQVVVTATRTARQLKETPILTRVITSSDISKYGRSKIEDILTTELAGIEFHQAGYGTTISFQGLDARHILFLIDGERVAGEIYGNIDFSRINPLSIERIEVMKGSSSVLYGSSAMGAIVNIITKEANDKIRGNLQFKYALPYQNNTKAEGKKSNIPNLDGAGFFAGRWGKISSVTDIKLQTSDPYRIVSQEMEKREYIFVDRENTTIDVPLNGIVYVPIDSSGISVSGWKMLSVTQKLGIDITSKLKLNIKGGYYTKERYDLNKYNQTQEQTTISNNYNGYTGYNIDGELIYSINDRHKLSLSAHNNVSKQKEYASESTTPKQNHQLLTPRLMYNFTHTKGRLVVGLDYDIEKLNYDLSVSGYSQRKSFSSVSFYAQEEWQVVKNLDITFGLRGLYKGFSDNSSSDSDKDNNIALTPKFAITYLLGQTTIRANWSMGYRNPTLKERYIKYFQPYMGSWIVGNNNLKAEQNNYVSLSGEYFSKSRKFTISAMAYANYFENKIDTYLDEKINSYVYANTEQTRILGFEVTGRVMALNNWWIGGNYAYNHNKENAPTNSSQYIFTSPHTANINSTYRYTIKKSTLELNIAGRYIGAKNYEDRMPTIIKYSGTPIPGIIFGKYKAHSDGYFILDGALSITYALKYKMILGVDNILNYKSKVASFNSATTPGIGGSITLAITF